MIDVKLHLHHNPQDLSEPWQMIACAKSRGKYTFDMMADDINHSCSLSHSDVAGGMVVDNHSKKSKKNAEKFW